MKVITTFRYEEEVEASSEEEARNIIEEAINNGDLDAVSETDDFDTEIEVWR